MSGKENTGKKQVEKPAWKPRGTGKQAYAPKATLGTNSPYFDCFTPILAAKIGNQYRVNWFFQGAI